MAAIDLAKRQVTRKTHADVGMLVANYPTIQDYVGEAVIDTNTSRAFVYQLTAAMDKKTKRDRVRHAENPKLQS